MSRCFLHPHLAKKRCNKTNKRQIRKKKRVHRHHKMCVLLLTLY
uniref:Uncharacterized protein n=1 Tax=Arundo donax TaxID=35708 RepID=A0A0A9A6X9_ARUDO